MNDTIGLRSINLTKILGIRTTGRRISIQCPFPNHNDKSPSFCIYPDNSFYCFGCGLHGTGAIDFAIAVNGGDPQSATKEQIKKALEDLKDYI